VVFHLDFARLRRLHFSFIFIPKANVDEPGTTAAVCLCHQCNQCIHVTDGTTVTALSASLQHKTSAVTFCLYHIAVNPNIVMCLCHIALNRSVLRKFKKWCKMFSHIRAKSSKRRLCKRDLHIFTIVIVMTLTSDMVYCNWGRGFLSTW
jgi:hypothetical protein